MPVIKMKTTESLTSGQKKELASGFVAAFADAGEVPVSKNLLTVIQDAQWMDFRGDSSRPAALLTVQPGPLTPEKDYAPIVAAFFRTIQQTLPQIPQERIYMTVANIDHWGWNGRLL